jgi:glucokinase
MNTLVIDIGGTKFALAVFQEDQIICRKVRTTDRNAGRDWMLRQILSIVNTWRQTIDLDRCGISFGGPVDFKTQCIRLSNHVSGWANFPLSRFLEEHLHIPVIMDNDANVSALGEALYGDHQGYDPLFFMTLSTGIGGGIIINGDIYRGAASSAGEIGHVTIHPETEDNIYRFHGIYERSCSGLWLAEKYGKSAEELFQDETFIQDYVVDLALGLKCVIMLLSPARVLIGGGMAKAGDKLFIPLNNELKRQIPPWFVTHVQVVPASLGDDSPLYGSLALSQTLS